MTKLIELDQASFSYGQGLVLEDIDLIVEEGDFIILIGDNGSGKTTLIKGLMGLLQAKSGKISYNLDGKAMAYIGQDQGSNQDFPASTYEVVLSGRVGHKAGKIFYSRDDREITRQVMEDLGIYEVKDQAYNGLSGGQRQKTLIGRALASQAQVLVLDEPSSGLSPEARADLYEVLEKIKKEDNKTIVMVSHDERETLPKIAKLLMVQDKKVRMV